eukprot:Em0008g427a
MPTFQAAPNVTALNTVTALSNPNGLLIHTCGPSSPLILNTNSSSMSLQWDAPLQPDYVITAYTLHHRVRSFNDKGLATFSGHMFLCGFINQAKVQFHAYNPNGILFYQINSVMTDFLGVKLHGGLPWLIFVVGSGPAVVGSNSTRTFNDGQWHTSPPVGSNLCDGQGYVVLFEQASNTFYVTVDMATVVYSGANLQATVTGLSPATLYFFSLVAYNAGGSTQSNASSVTTIESSPDGVPFPNVTINATAPAIVWSTPLVPSGIVTGYVVLQTNIPSGFSYVSTDLQPFTAHSCSILACTHEEDSPPGGPPDPELDTDDIVISVFINKIINPDKSFGSSDPMCILLLQLSSLLVEHTAPHIHDSNKYVGLEA